MSNDKFKDVNPSEKITMSRLVQQGKISMKGKIKFTRPSKDEVT